MPTTVATAWAEEALTCPRTIRSARRFQLILLANHVAIAVAVAAVVDTTVVAIAVIVVAVSSGSGCSGSYCGGPDCRSAIRIPAAPSCATIDAAAIGNATACNADSTATHTYRANTGTATTVSERVMRNKDGADKNGGSETYESFSQHWCSPVADHEG
jgi:hypothetical protein